MPPKRPRPSTANRGKVLSDSATGKRSKLVNSRATNNAPAVLAGPNVQGESQSEPAAADAERLPVTLMLWNVENFTSHPRPNFRGLNTERIGIVRNTIEQSDADVAVILESGTDTKDALQKGWAKYRVLATPVTGPDSDDYGGENYLVVVKNAKRVTLTPTIVGTDATETYRGGCLFELDKTLAVCVLHAPSPSHGLEERKRVIAHVSRQAAARVRDKGLLFCGDLNFKQNEQEELESALDGFVFAGPKGPRGVPQLTSLPRVKRAVLEQTGSQPYDQVWANLQVDLSTVQVDVGQPNFGSLKIKSRVQQEIWNTDLKPTANPADAMDTRSSNVVYADARGLIVESKELLATIKSQPIFRREGHGWREMEQVVAIVETIMAFKYESNAQVMKGFDILRSAAAAAQYIWLGNDTGQTKKGTFEGIATRVLVSDHLPIVARVQVAT